MFDKTNKKKPRKKMKSQVKKLVPAVPKTRPQQWIPPFPKGNVKQKTKSVEKSEAQVIQPKLIHEKPTYILPAPHEEQSIDSETLKTETTTNPKDQEIRKEFMRIFKELTHRWRSWDIWTDFVTMVACAISNSVDSSHYDEREELYLRTINKYNKEEQMLFPELFAYLVLALEENQEQDFLGDIYTELGLNSKEHMQIFTPYHIAHLMAQITLVDVEKQIEEKGIITVHDCCCGGGVTLIAAANVIKEKLAKMGRNYQDILLVTGQDIDQVAAMMCYIQLSLLGVAGYFKVGDSLTDPMNSGDSLDNYWFTPMYYFPTWQFRRLFWESEKLFQHEN